MIGVYCITNTLTGALYIGSSVSIERRWYYGHLWQLRRNSHHSRYLQRSWNQCGEDAFSLSVLEECGRGALLVREQWWIDHLSPEYNAGPADRRDLGARLEMSAQRANKRIKPVRWDDEDVEEMRRLSSMGTPQAVIARDFGISPSYLSEILRGAARLSGHRECPGHPGRQIGISAVLCAECRDQYGDDPALWPAWLNFLAHSNRRMRLDDNNHERMAVADIDLDQLADRSGNA